MTSQTNQSAPLEKVEPTLVPRRKVLASGFSGALVTMVVVILNTYIIPDKKIPAELSSAATVVLSSLIAYKTPPDPRETTTTEHGVTKSARQSSSSLAKR